MIDNAIDVDKMNRITSVSINMIISILYWHAVNIAFVKDLHGKV